MKKKSFEVNVIYSDPERSIPFGDVADVKLLSCHLTPIPAGLEVRKHEHSHWELSFMIFGEMKTYCDNGIVDCSEKNDSILLIPPGTLHHRKFGTDKCNCNLSIEFLLNDPELIHSAVQLCGSCFYQFQPNPFLHSLLAEIRRLAGKNIDSPNWLLAQLSQVFLLTFLRDILHVTAGQKRTASATWKFQTNKKRADDVFRYLNTNISSRKLLEKVALFFSLSLKQLNRIFEPVYHKTLFEAVDEIRFKRAVLLLKSTDLTIHEISEETGFTGAAGFYAFFRRHAKKTPQSFRRLNCKKGN